MQQGQISPETQDTFATCYCHMLSAPRAMLWFGLVYGAPGRIQRHACRFFGSILALAKNGKGTSPTLHVKRDKNGQRETHAVRSIGQVALQLKPTYSKEPLPSLRRFHGSSRTDPFGTLGSIGGLLRAAFCYCGRTKSISHHLRNPGMIRFQSKYQQMFWFQPSFLNGGARSGFRNHP